MPRRVGRSLLIKNPSVTTLLPFPFFILFVFRWQIDDLNQRCSNPFASFARRPIFRIAGNPQDIHPVNDSDPSQQFAGFPGIMMPSPLRFNVVSKVTAKTHETEGVS